MRQHYAKTLSDQLDLEVGLPETIPVRPVRKIRTTLGYITVLAWSQQPQQRLMSRWLRGIPS